MKRLLMVLALSVVGCAEATTDEAPDAIEGAGGMETQGAGGMRGTGGHIPDPAPDCEPYYVYVQGLPCTTAYNASGSTCAFCAFEGGPETPTGGCAVRGAKRDVFCVDSAAQCTAECTRPY